MKSLKKIWIGKSKKRLSFYLIMLLCFTCATLIVVSSVLQETDKIPNEESTTEVQEPILEEIQPIEEIIPDQETEFFSKEGGKPLLYYAIVNDSVKFYKTTGKEPVTGQELLPVTQEIIDQYKEITAPKKELAVTETRNYKVNEVKIIKKEKKPEVIEKPKRESIWNETLLNSAKEDEISVFVFNDVNELDQPFVKKFRSEFEKKDYFVTEEIIHSDMMNKDIASHLKSANVQFFEGNLKKYTDYICIGKVSSSYTQNEYRNDFLDCTLEIVYFIYDAATGEQMFSEKDKLIGSGQTKDRARKEAIEKFIL